MKPVRIICTATLMLFALLAAPQYDFAKTTTKKQKMTVTVGDDCEIGVALAVTASDNALCASYPRNAIAMLRQHKGESIQIEAVFQYSGDPKNSAPSGIRSVTRVAGAKVYDPCSTGNAIMWGTLTGLSHTPASLPPGCAESLEMGGTTAVNDSSSAALDAGTPVSTNTAPPTAAASNVGSPSSRFISGLPQCARTQYENHNATLWIVNTCNVAVTVEMTSDSGNTWGEVNVDPGSRVAATMFGIGYSPQKDGTVYLFTCPKGSSPVMPNGNPWIGRSYKGQYTCMQ